MTTTANSLLVGFTIAKSQGLTQANATKAGLLGSMMAKGDPAKSALMTVLVAKMLARKDRGGKPAIINLGGSSKDCDDKDKPSGESASEANAEAIEALTKCVEELSSYQGQIIAAITKPDTAADQKTGSAPAKQSKPKT